jgi:hypothetical protein
MEAFLKKSVFRYVEDGIGEGSVEINVNVNVLHSSDDKISR